MTEEFDFETLNIKIPKREHNSHKGNFGRVLVLGGSEGMGGAAILSSEASLYSGAGLTHLYTHPTNVEASLKRNPEIMSLGINSNFEIPHNIDVLVCGPGLGDDSWSKDVYEKIFQNKNVNTIILDAGALSFINKFIKNILELESELILTPHPGEASKLLDVSIEEIQQDRPAAAIKISKKYCANVILKGNRTLVCSKENLTLYECLEGGPELSTGGTGDVLAGVIGGLVAQNNNALDSCLLSVAAHSRSGKMFKEEIGEIGLNASDLICRIRELLNK